MSYKGYTGKLPLNKRDPVSHRTGKQQRDKQLGYNSTPKEQAKRAERHKARDEIVREGHIRAGDTNHEVDHRRPLAKGGSNNVTNLEVLTRRQNRQKGDR
jgi:5-methylcytosine-specific restriction endonuclease McrA